MIVLLAQCIPWAPQTCTVCGKSSPITGMVPIVDRVLTGWRHDACPPTE